MNRPASDRFAMIASRLMPDHRVVETVATDGSSHATFADAVTPGLEVVQQKYADVLSSTSSSSSRTEDLRRKFLGEDAASAADAYGNSTSDAQNNTQLDQDDSGTVLMVPKSDGTGIEQTPKAVVVSGSENRVIGVQG